MSEDKKNYDSSGKLWFDVENIVDSLSLTFIERPKVYLCNSKREPVLEFEDWDTYISFLSDLVEVSKCLARLVAIFEKYKGKIRVMKRNEASGCI